MQTDKNGFYQFKRFVRQLRSLTVTATGLAILQRPDGDAGFQDRLRAHVKLVANGTTTVEVPGCVANRQQAGPPTSAIRSTRADFLRCIEGRRLRRRLELDSRGR